MIGYQEALELLQSRIVPLVDVESVRPAHACGRVLAEDLFSRVDVPPVAVSLRDGYAIPTPGQGWAGSHKRQRSLRVVGMVRAGGAMPGRLRPGTAVEVTTGAPVPPGTYAVLESERCRREGDRIFFSGQTEKGIHVRAAGADVTAGKPLGRKGQRLSAGMAARLAAGGLDLIPVIRRPTVALLATGDEVALPGTPLRPGGIYSSNTVSGASWLGLYGASALVRRVPDNAARIENAIERLGGRADLLFVSGGTAAGRKDLVVEVLDAMGWEAVFRGLRIRPGASTAFGVLGELPILCLPGSPSAHEASFLSLALPAVVRRAGWREGPFWVLRARAAVDLCNQGGRFTRFFHAALWQDTGGLLRAAPLGCGSPLDSIALGRCLIVVPERKQRIRRGGGVDVYVCSPECCSFSAAGQRQGARWAVRVLGPWPSAAAPSPPTSFFPRENLC